MDEPTAGEIADLLRSLLPEAMRETFDADMTMFEDGEGDVHVCGVFAAFGWSFRRLIAGRDAPSITAILAFTDELLEQYWPPPGFESNVVSSVLTCFFENVLPVGPEEYPVVGPFLGPRLRAYALTYDPWWLVPNPNVDPARP
jgi:hypothetical protein